MHFDIYTSIRLVQAYSCVSVFTFLIQSVYFLRLFRPPDIVCRRTYILPGFLSSFLSFFISYSLSSPNRTQPYLATWSEVSVIWKCMSEIWGIPSPYKLGPKNHFFGRLRNSVATLIAYIFGTKHDINNQPSALQATRDLLHRLQTTWTLLHKWLQIGSEFSPTLRKISIPLHCQASQMEISKQNSTTLCQTVDGRWC